MALLMSELLWTRWLHNSCSLERGRGQCRMVSLRFWFGREGEGKDGERGGREGGREGVCVKIYMYMYVNKARQAIHPRDFRCPGWESNPRQEGALPAELTKQLNWLSQIQDRRTPSTCIETMIAHCTIQMFTSTTHTHTHAHAHTRTHTRAHAHAHAHSHTHTHTHTHTHSHTHTHTHTHTHILTYMYIHVHVQYIGDCVLRDMPAVVQVGSEMYHDLPATILHQVLD